MIKLFTTPASGVLIKKESYKLGNNFPQTPKIFTSVLNTTLGKAKCLSQRFV